MFKRYMSLSVFCLLLAQLTLISNSFAHDIPSVSEKRNCPHCGGDRTRLPHDSSHKAKSPE